MSDQLQLVVGYDKLKFVGHKQAYRLSYHRSPRPLATISRGPISSPLRVRTRLKRNAVVRRDPIVVGATRPVVDHAAFVSTNRGRFKSAGFASGEDEQR